MNEQFWPIKDISFRIFTDHWNANFYIRARHHDGRTAFARLEWVEQDDDNAAPASPFISITPWEEHSSSSLIPKEEGITVLQVLMDDLWNCGIRPTEGKGSAGQLDAVQNHLNDMRRIAQKLLKVNLP